MRRFPSRRLSLETLEQRRVLTTYTVDTLVDENDGNFAPGDISLREAIFVANSGGADVINFAPKLAGGTINLASQLEITQSVSIQGLGASKLTLTGGGGEPLLVISEGFRNVPTVQIRGLKFSGANTTFAGAAMESIGSNVTVRECFITANHTTDIGGGIVVSGANGALTLIDSTLSGNTAEYGGGVAVVNGGRLNVINSTISGNKANDSGGGIQVTEGQVQIVNSTIALNRANSNGAHDHGPDLGGGINRGGGTVSINNSIVAGNLVGTSSTANDINGSVTGTSTHNFIGNLASAGGLTNGADGNIVGGVSPSNVFNPNLRFNGGKTPTHALVPGGVAIDAGDNALAIDAGGVALARDQNGTARVIDGDLSGVKTVDLGAVEFGRAPALGLTGTVSYTENGPAIVLAPNATVSDADSTNFANGKLMVSITANGGAADRLSVRSQGTAAGQISVVGSLVKLGGVGIGTMSGGVGTQPLVISLNNNATISATRTLIRNIVFSNVSDAPDTSPRTISFVLSDSTFLSSSAKTVTAKVVARNDAPTLGNDGSSTFTYAMSINRGQSPLPKATLADPDSTNFAGGTLTVDFTEGQTAKDVLSLDSAFVITGGTVKYNNISIGTLTGGTGGTGLAITFNANATRAIVLATIKSVTFYIRDPNIDGEPNRRIRYTLTDGDGGESNSVSILIEPKFVRV